LKSFSASAIPTSFFGKTSVSFAVMTVSAIGESERMPVMTRPLLSSMTVAAHSFGMTLPTEN
jgi:hypothetical protein